MSADNVCPHCAGPYLDAHGICMACERTPALAGPPVPHPTAIVPRKFEDLDERALLLSRVQYEFWQRNAPEGAPVHGQTFRQYVEDGLYHEAVRDYIEATAP